MVEVVRWRAVGSEVELQSMLLLVLQIERSRAELQIVVVELQIVEVELQIVEVDIVFASYHHLLEWHQTAMQQ